MIEPSGRRQNRSITLGFSPKCMPFDAAELCRGGDEVSHIFGVVFLLGRTNSTSLTVYGIVSAPHRDRLFLVWGGSSLFFLSIFSKSDCRSGPRNGSSRERGHENVVYIKFPSDFDDETTVVVELELQQDKNEAVLREKPQLERRLVRGHACCRGMLTHAQRELAHRVSKSPLSVHPASFVCCLCTNEEKCTSVNRSLV